jgi:hypothetical protein
MQSSIVTSPCQLEEVSRKLLEAYRRQSVICLLLLSPLCEQAMGGRELEVINHVYDAVWHGLVTGNPG